MNYDHLFSPIKIGNMEVKNRVFMSAMNTLYNPDGKANERFNNYFWARAEGGIGLAVTGGAYFDEYGSTYSMMSMADDSVIEGYKEFTEGMHERGAKVAVQIFHGGRYANPECNDGRQPLAPSPIYSGYSRATPKEMTEEEIKTVIEKWAAAAARAKKCGFDMVEISASAGYLICEFLSPFTNTRTDQYGGSFENRVRFPKELMKAVRGAVGDDYPLSIRIAGNDLVPGSCTDDDAVMFAAEMERSGVSMINVTGGWHESKVPQITGELPRGGFDIFAERVRNAVSILVAASNRINDPDVAERMLATGVCDIVSLGRPNIADPCWCKKAEEGEPETIRRCVACNQGCLARAFFNKPVECLVNARVGREYQVKDIEDLKLRNTEKKNKILVIGGGVSGCEFAFRSAELGHDVTLWEKADRLGGQIFIASQPPHKEEFRTIISYYKNILKKYNVDVVLGKEAEAEEIEKGGYDYVVTATGRGAAPNIKLDIEDGLPVYKAEDVLMKRVMTGKNVVVVGGGSVGCETAEYIADEASVSPEQVFHMLRYGYESDEKIKELMNTCRRNITIVDILEIGKGFEAGTAWPVMAELRRMGVKKYPFTGVREIKNGEAVLDVREKENGEIKETVTAPCDTVVMAVGARPNDSLYNELTAKGVRAYNIGDSVKVRNAISGISRACELVEELAGIERE